MPARLGLKDAIKAIERRGVCLVYPLENRREPASLWTEFFPRSPMRWEWDSGGDARVAKLWYLREELSRSGKVVYAKWYRGRATFFSRNVFPAFLRILSPDEPDRLALDEEARRVLGVLEEDSPLSTKQLKDRSEMTGRLFEAEFARATRALWQRLLIVGFGEVDDGAFPSLNHGATRLLFEELWRESRELSEDEAWERIAGRLEAQSPFFKELERLRRRLLPREGFVTRDLS